MHFPSSIALGQYSNNQIGWNQVKVTIIDWLRLYMVRMYGTSIYLLMHTCSGLPYVIYHNALTQMNARSHGHRQAIVLKHTNLQAASEQVHEHTSINAADIGRRSAFNDTDDPGVQAKRATILQ